MASSENPSSGRFPVFTNTIHPEFEIVSHLTQMLKDNCIDLGLIYRNPNPKKLIDLGVKFGAAEHIVYDVEMEAISKAAQNRGISRIR